MRLDRLPFETATPRPASRACRVLALACALGASVLARGAQSGPLRMEVLVNGSPLAEYAARGTRYIEAQAGAEYSIRLTNTSGGRIAVALAVDGLNSIDARHTPAREARKWVLDPWESAVISGWQVAGDRARAFFFTTETHSYGAWLGETRNLGAIEAVVYREKRRPPPRWSPPVTPAPAPDYDGGAYNRSRDEDDGRGAAKAYPREAPAPSGAPAGEVGAGAAGDSVGSMNGAAEAPSVQQPPAASPAPPPSDDYAATGIGRSTYHPVDTIDIDLERHPAGSVQLRYEYRDALVRLGVLPRPVPPWRRDPLDRRERSRGFGWAPEPGR